MADMVEKKPALELMKNYVNLHGNDIFLGLGIGFGIGAIGLAIFGTVKAVKLVEEKKAELKEKNPDVEPQLSKKEVLKTVWKCYIPTAVAEAFSLGCTVRSGVISNKAVAAATAAYKITEGNFADYKKAATEILGEKKEKRIEEQSAQTYLDRNPINGRSPIDTGHGDTRFIDSWHGAAFKSSINYVESCKNKVNEMINGGDAVSLNDWYDLLNLHPDEAGYDEGWSADTTGLMDIWFDPGVWTDGEPCFVIKYHVKPTNRYMS